MKKYNFTLIIPSLNPDEKLSHTVRLAVEAGIGDIILVDDGSDAGHKHYFDELVKKYPQVTLLSHEKILAKALHSRRHLSIS